MKRETIRLWRITILVDATQYDRIVSARSSLEAGAEFIRLWPGVTMVDIREAFE